MEMLDEFNVKRGNVVADKSFAFAVRILAASKRLAERKTDFALSRQLLKSGTSIGANIQEALGAHSRAEFAAKLGIAYKEARETSYWIRLLRAGGYFTSEEAISLYRDNEELLKIIGSIRVSIRAR